MESCSDPAMDFAHGGKASLQIRGGRKWLESGRVGFVLVGTLGKKRIGSAGKGGDKNKTGGLYEFSEGAGVTRDVWGPRTGAYGRGRDICLDSLEGPQSKLGPLRGNARNRMSGTLMGPAVSGDQMNQRLPSKGDGKTGRVQGGGNGNWRAHVALEGKDICAWVGGEVWRGWSC